MVADLREIWPVEVLTKFYRRLEFKIKLLEDNPDIGFKSKKHSRFRKTLITRNYLLVYSVKQKRIVILQVKHTKEK